MRAKDHSEKVLQTVNAKREREASAQKLKEQEIESRLKAAEEKRAQVTDMKIAAARAAMVMRSASKDKKESTEAQ